METTPCVLAFYPREQPHTPQTKPGVVRSQALTLSALCPKKPQRQPWDSPSTSDGLETAFDPALVVARSFSRPSTHRHRQIPASIPTTTRHAAPPSQMQTQPLDRRSLPQDTDTAGP
eukprot:146550-Rhodomonas_salina.1